MKARAFVSHAAESEWAIGLYAYSDTPPPSSRFSELHEVVLRFLTRMELELTHIAVVGTGYRDKLVKANGAVARRLLDSGFDSITGLVLNVTPVGSDAPAYDRVFSAGLTWNRT